MLAKLIYNNTQNFMGIFNFLKTKTTKGSQKYKDGRKAECPNCQNTLNKIPGAKTKCPHCGKIMFVRTRPDGVRLVVTERQAKDIEQMENFLKFAGVQCGITPKEILEREKNSVDMKNALWSLGNEYLLKNQQTGNYDNVISLYRALEKIRISKNKSANYIVKRRLYYELLQMKQQKLPIAIITCGYDSCDACKKLDGKEYSINEAFELQPLPPENCTCLRCTCSY